MATAINPSAVWSPFGTFSMAVVQGDGHIVHLKGQVSLDVHGHIVGRGNIRAQIRQTLENIRDILRSIGGSMSDILSLVHYTTDIEAFMAAGDIRAEFFAVPYPATTTVQIQRLYHIDLMVEITAVAEIPRSRFRVPDASQIAVDDSRGAAK